MEGPALMEIAVIPATSADTLVLTRLGQLSSYDFSEYGGNDVDAHGLFGAANIDNPYGLDPDEVDPLAFLIRVGGQLAGYAVVTRHDSYLEHGKPYLLSQ